MNLGILLQASGGVSPQMFNILFLVLLVGIFYFFMLRPQQKKQRAQKTFLEALAKGDSIVTIGGLHGKIVSIEATTVQVEAYKGVILRFDKTAISLEQTKRVQETAKTTANAE